LKSGKGKFPFEICTWHTILGIFLLFLFKTTLDFFWFQYGFLDFSGFPARIYERGILAGIKAAPIILILNVISGTRRHRQLFGFENSGIYCKEIFTPI